MSGRQRPRRKKALKKTLQGSASKATDRPELYSSIQEEQRALVLGSTRLLDTDPEERFDRICRLAQHVSGAPATYISLIDRDRQWFKSTCGMGDVKETPREGTFCDYAIRRSLPTVVLDATADPLFARSPYVADGPKVRFYAGFPLTVEGQRVGTLCALDFEPRSDVSEQQLEQLYELARMAERELTLDSELNLDTSAVEADLTELTLVHARLTELNPWLFACPPEMTVAVLNLYIAAVAELAAHYQGELSELAEGAVDLSFRGQDHTIRGAACALDMLRILPHLNEALAARELESLAVGIGVHTAEMISATLGSGELRKQTHLGPDSSLPRRLALAGEGRVLITPSVAEALGELASFEDDFETLLEATSLTGVGEVRLGR